MRSGTHERRRGNCVWWSPILSYWCPGDDSGLVSETRICLGGDRGLVSETRIYLEDELGFRISETKWTCVSRRRMPHSQYR